MLLISCFATTVTHVLSVVLLSPAYLCVCLAIVLLSYATQFSVSIVDAFKVNPFFVRSLEEDSPYVIVVMVHRPCATFSYNKKA